MKRLLFLLLTWAIPLSAWAQSSSTGNTLNLTPPPTDISVGYLSNIFGTVDGVLHGTGSQLLGNMFGIFNAAVLVLGGIIVLYTLFVSTLNTAHQGEVMGKDWSSIWIPLRSVLGIALLIPKASGYCFLQIAVMWIAVMGIGAADSIWNSAVDYVSIGGSVIQQNRPPPKAVVQNAGKVLTMLTCSNMLQDQLERYRQEQINGGSASVYPTVPNFYQYLLSSLNSGGANQTLQFPSSNLPAPYNTLAGACGSISWSGINGILPDYMISGGRVKPEYAYLSNVIIESKTRAVTQMINSLQPSAKVTVMNFNLNKIPLGQITSNDPLTWGSGSSNNTYLLQGSVLSDAASDYMGVMGPITRTLSAGGNNALYRTKELSEGKSKGWAAAGQYYYDIIQANSYATTSWDASGEISITPTSQDLTQQTKITSKFNGGGSSSYVQNINNLVNGKNNYSLSPYIGEAINYGSQLNYGSLSTAPTVNQALGGGDDDAGEIINGALTGLSEGLSNVIEAFYSLMMAQQTNADPVSTLTILGTGLVSQSITWMLTISTAVFAVTFGMGAAFGFTFSSSVMAMIIPFTAVLSPIFMILITTGLTLAYYLPLIPFILFTFGVIGWFITVIEGMVAAPLVALGITHPEGHAILGKADPAIILLANIFLRPTLMIIGFMVGMMLSYVSVWLLNQGFFHIFFKVFLGSSPGVSAIFGLIAYLVIYTIIVIQLVHKSFSMTYVIPDAVFKWIGGNIQGMGGEAEAEGQIAGKFQQAAQVAGQAASTSFDKSIESGQAANQFMDKAGKTVTSTLSKGGDILDSGLSTVTGGNLSGGGGAGGGSGGGAGGGGGFFEDGVVQATAEGGAREVGSIAESGGKAIGGMASSGGGSGGGGAAAGAAVACCS